MLNFNQSLLITSSVIGIKKPEINNRLKPVYDIFLLLLTRWVKLNDLNFDIINWSVKDKFIDILH